MIIKRKDLPLILSGIKVINAVIRRFIIGKIEKAIKPYIPPHAKPKFSQIPDTFDCSKGKKAIILNRNNIKKRAENKQQIK